MEYNDMKFIVNVHYTENKSTIQPVEYSSLQDLSVHMHTHTHTHRKKKFSHSHTSIM